MKRSLLSSFGTPKWYSANSEKILRIGTPPKMREPYRNLKRLTRSSTSCAAIFCGSLWIRWAWPRPHWVGYAEVPVPAVAPEPFLFLLCFHHPRTHVEFRLFTNPKRKTLLDLAFSSANLCVQRAFERIDRLKPVEVFRGARENKYAHGPSIWAICGAEGRS